MRNLPVPGTGENPGTVEGRRSIWGPGSESSFKGFTKVARFGRCLSV
jgi:hypothetical protein